MTLKKRIATFILLLALVFTMGGDLYSALCIRASAEETTSYSNVLDDLKKDETFNVEDYPAKANDYSLKVIQIAESIEGELFVYVYQPNFEIYGAKASYVNMSLQDQRDVSAELKHGLYSLTFINSNGPLCKYVVNNFTVIKDSVRYYSIPVIFRPYDSNIDDTYEAIDETNHVKNTVAKMWCVYSHNDTLKYECVDIDVAEVEITASGEIRYEDGYLLYFSGCNSHYFAFKIDNYDVKYIYDADVTYKLVPYWHTTSNTEPKQDTSRETIVVESKTIFDSELVTYETKGMLSKEYEWKRIQTVSEFLEENQKMVME